MCFSVLGFAIIAEKMCPDTREAPENEISAKEQKDVLQTLLFESITCIWPEKFFPKLHILDRFHSLSVVILPEEGMQGF